ncbi:MAG TPA: ROK family glucokinase [Candidatus Anaerobutyricum avicola]|nr:ROK family glucokinase [Candidatus Anaerobutyricum avicola]
MKKYAFGADIGGTTVKLGLFTVEGELLDKWEIPTRTGGEYDILQDVADSCREKMEQKGLSADTFAGIGIGVPGPVREDGSVDVCVNLGWGKKQVRDEMAAALGMAVAVANDANVAALGEMWQGGGKGYENVVMVTLGTGVGGGIIVGGKVISGAHGYGGEIGHMCINTHETEYCNCGKKGCLEQYASATGIVRMAKKALAASEEDTVLRRADSLTAKDVLDAAKFGDAFAVRLTEEFCRRLARGLSFISCVTDPDIFVIGGGVSKAGEIITKTVEKHFADFVFGSQKDTKFGLAILGNDAGIYGCAKLIIENA